MKTCKLHTNIIFYRKALKSKGKLTQEKTHVRKTPRNSKSTKTATKTHDGPLTEDIYLARISISLCHQVLLYFAAVPI